MQQDVPQIKPEQYERYADCIRSDQVSASDTYALMQHNPEFANWYREHYEEVRF